MGELPGERFHVVDRDSVDSCRKRVDHPLRIMPQDHPVCHAFPLMNANASKEGLADPVASGTLIFPCGSSEGLTPTERWDNQ